MSDIADSIARNAGIGPRGTTISANTATPGQEPVKRHNPVLNPGMHPRYRKSVRMLINPKGDWVPFADYDRDIKALEATIARLERELHGYEYGST